MAWVMLLLAMAIVIWGWRSPRSLVPLLIAALPLEISRTWFPHLVVLEKLGAFVGVIDFGRILALALILYFVYTRVRRENPWNNDNKLESFLTPMPGALLRPQGAWRNPLFLISGLYILFGLASLLWSVDRLHTLSGVARLALLWVLGLAVYRLISEQRNYWLIPQSFAVMGTALAGVGIYEYLSKNFLWLGDIYQVLGRYNATFVDANIYARFLVLGMLGTLVWLVFNRSLTGKALGYAALGVQLLALLTTGSRTGWFVFLVVFLMFALFVPRMSLFVMLAGGLVLGGAVLFLNPEMVSRVKDLGQGFWAASTQRQYLLQSGWDMFVKHPFLGVGLGGFQEMMLTQYASRIQNGVSLSHTALMTTASELGIIGIGITAAYITIVFLRIFRAGQLQKFCTEGSEGQGQALLTIFASLGILVVLLSAQGEGRFWEDPYLWILAGLSGAVTEIEEVD